MLLWDSAWPKNPPPPQTETVEKYCFCGSKLVDCGGGLVVMSIKDIRIELCRDYPASGKDLITRCPRRGKIFINMEEMKVCNNSYCSASGRLPNLCPYKK